MRVAFLGLGIMGSRMAANLARAGFDLLVWNRTAARADEFAGEHRAEVAPTPAAAAAEADVVVTMVVDGPQVDEVLLGPDGAATSGRDGRVFLDCSTIGALEARRIGAAVAERGSAFLDAPVTGSAPKAQDGTLTIMVGGEEDALERARPVLEAMGALIVHAGPLGHGQTVKLINNAVAAVNCATVAQALVAGAGAGVDLDALVQVMGAGSGASTMLSLKAAPMREHDWTPLFKLAHMLKDVRLCLDEGQEAGVAFPFAALTREWLGAAAGMGLGEQDFAAVLEVVEGMAGRSLSGN